MKVESYNIRLAKRAYWLIKLRWIAIAGVCLAIFIAGNILRLGVQSVQLYGVAAMLILENVMSLLLLKRLLKTRKVIFFNSVGKIIHFQICIDLLLLTTLLHYSGGIENPFVVYFVFHVAIASILLPVRESYLQATFAVSLLIMLALFEYKGIVPHYCLKGFIVEDEHFSIFYASGVIGVMASTFYLIVYMVSDITSKLRKQEEAYRQINLELQQKDGVWS